MIKQFFYLTIFAFFLFSCTSTKVKNELSNGKSTYKTVAIQKYLSDVNYLFSPDSIYVVCYKMGKQSEGNNLAQLKFFIFNTKTNSIEFEDNSRTDTIEWINNFKLKVSKRPGIISVKPKINNKLLGYIYNLKKHKKKSLEKLKKLNSF